MSGVNIGYSATLPILIRIFALLPTLHQSYSRTAFLLAGKVDYISLLYPLVSGTMDERPRTLATSLVASANVP